MAMQSYALRNNPELPNQGYQGGAIKFDIQFFTIANANKDAFLIEHCLCDYLNRYQHHAFDVIFQKGPKMMLVVPV